MPLFSHYGDVADISDRLAVPALVFTIVTPLFIVARLWSRKVFAKHIGADDWVILASWIFAETVSIQMIIICQWAFGKHKADVSDELLMKSLKLYFFAQILYKINIGLTKISILLLYIRVFIRPWFTRTCWVCIGIIVAFTTGTVFASIFQCVPVPYAFDKKLRGGGECLNLTAFWYANAAFNISSDIVIIALPIPVISKLHSPLKTKIAVSSVFAVGLFVCVTSVLRITTLNVATSRFDIPWTNIGSSMWTVIETNIGIICACMPTLWRPLSLLFPWLSSHLTNNTKYGTGQSSQSQPQTPRRTKVSSVSAREVTGYWTKIGSSDEQLAHDYRIYSPVDRERRGDSEGSVPFEEDGEAEGIRKTTQVSVQYGDGDASENTQHGDQDIEMSRVGYAQ